MPVFFAAASTLFNPPVNLRPDYQEFKKLFSGVSCEIGRPHLEFHHAGCLPKSTGFVNHKHGPHTFDPPEKTTVSKLQMVVEEKEVWSRKAENGLMLVSELDMIRSFLFGDQLTAIFLAFLACALFLCDLLLFPFSDLAGPERVRTLDQMNHCG